MTGRDDFEQQLAGHLTNRAPSPPPGVLETILRETEAMPQRHRALAFTTVGWLGLGAAAAVAVVVAAIVLGSGPISFPVAPGTHATPSPTAAPRVTTIVLPVPVKDKAIAEEAATVFAARLTALGLGNFTSSIGDDMRFSFVLPPSVSAADVDAVLHTAGRFEFLAWSEGMPVVTVGDTVPDGIPVLFDQSHITSVALTTTNHQSPPTEAVEMHLDALATQALATYTLSHINQPGPIALDGEVIATPIVQSAITDGDLIMTFGALAEPGTISAAAMVAILQSGPVPTGWTMSTPSPEPASSGSTHPGAIHDPATLPDTLTVCGRQWSKDTTGRQFSLAQIQSQSSGDPVVVDPGASIPCPIGACSQNASNTPCATVIYVRVGEDAYVDYALQGGP